MIEYNARWLKGFWLTTWLPNTTMRSTSWRNSLEENAAFFLCVIDTIFTETP